MQIKTTILALIGLWAISVPAATNNSIDIRSLLSQRSNNWSQGTIISFPNSTTFDNSTTRWSTYDAPSYLAAISPANEADVAKTVRLASSHRIPFLATGGRHGYTTTLGDLQGGLAIDLSQFKSYSIDRAAGTLTVGGATTLGDFQDALYEAGYMIQTASISCPGYVGVTVGSGVGRFTGLFGLVADALISARLVTAEGRIIHVSRRQNADLFWGLRGAGANLGVVVSATYQAHKLVNQGQILNADLIFPANQSKEYFDVLQSFIGKMPAKLAVVSLIVFDPVAQAVSWGSISFTWLQIPG
ncbi:MAG: hypothetical protein Q9210_000607 [Variospora velana]